MRLIERDLIRVDWKNHQTSITPNIDKTLKILGEKIPIRDQNGGDNVTDFTSLEKLDPEDQERIIRELAETGDLISARKVVQTLYGCSTTEAIHYARKLLEE